MNTIGIAQHRRPAHLSIEQCYCSGASLLEFAIVLPLILIVGAGAINIGMWIWQIIVVMEGTRGAGRAGSLAFEVAPVMNLANRALTCVELEQSVDTFNATARDTSGVKVSAEAGDGRNWNSVVSNYGVKSESWGTVAGNPRDFVFLTVTQATSSGKTCLFCFGGIWESLDASFQSLFLLPEGGCSP